MDIPVYLMTGFLESGKTKFLQETLADKNFFDDKKDKTLVIQFEEGEEELDPSGFAPGDIFCEIIDDAEKLNKRTLAAFQTKYKATRVIIEYNGMWLLKDLVAAFPDGWFVYQEITFSDATTFEVYNANMRNLVVDKFTNADLIVFNRCETDTNLELFHKIVRGVNRRGQILYERTNGQIAYDDIEDPLPFDITAPVIEIDDRDYALFYRDLSENMNNYDGKTVKFCGTVSKSDRLPRSGFVIGRPIMTCCVEDIAFSGLFCENGADKVNAEKWVELTAKINVKNSSVYGRKGPVLKLMESIEKPEPENTVATFY